MNDITAAVAALKEQLGDRLCIMGHHYQNDAVVAHCDVTGDSLELARRVPGVEDVRVLGGIGVVETKQPVNTAALQNCFVEQGVWIRPFNRLIYLMPPYVSPIEDVARLCEAVETALRRGVHCA